MSRKIEIGDLVIVHNWNVDPIFADHHKPARQGIVVAFNEKGEGGKDFIHVLIDGTVGAYFKESVCHWDDRENW